MRKQMRYKMISPISHIGETASTGSYFQTILTSAGRLPVITGNSIRGKLRDSIALHFLENIECKLKKDIFNIFFSGGNINGTLKYDIEKSKQIREHFPMISLLGAGVGDMIMAGKLIVSFSYPICTESMEITGVESYLSWHNLIDEIEFTRMDDSKNDVISTYLEDANEEKSAKASTQMRFSVQYMAPGTEFMQKFLFLDEVNELELGAFYAGIKKWFEVPSLGGMNAKGFGIFDAQLDDDIEVKNGVIKISEKAQNLIFQYEDFLKREGADYLSIFDTKKGGTKNGKKAN